ANPVEETVAIDELLVAQVTTRPVRVLPEASFWTDVYCCELPATTLAVDGLTVVEATATVVAVTVAVAWPDLPPLVAAIDVVPALTAVAFPLEFTVDRKSV